MIDFDALQKVADTVQPKLIICGFSAYSRKINFKKFKQIAGIC